MNALGKNITRPANIPCEKKDSAKFLCDAWMNEIKIT